LRADDKIICTVRQAWQDACIHPSQIAVVRAAFLPSAEEIKWAREVTHAAATASGVFRFAGRMVDAPVLARAAEILRQAGDHPQAAC
jgi:citrate lyase subunit beta/citryl-CoA lyase